MSNETVTKMPDLNSAEGEPTLVVVDVPDEQRDAMVTSIRLLGDEYVIEEESPDTPVFANWDELEQVAQITKSGGVWVDVKCMVPGSQLLMGDAADALRELQRLDRLFRKQNPRYNKLDKGGKPVELPDGTRKLPSGQKERNVQQDIFIAATFGTAVKGWRGPGFTRADGTPVPFDEENYAKACQFNYLGGEITKHMGDTGVSALELVRGNS